ncbi:MAG: hypothetical protein KAT70_07655 [Thermoplasmata archaeon]|nr:hypothetical protein [Thermoplasmata archaeon]
MSKDRMFYLNEFKSEECYCGKDKKTRTAFCYRCYESLPNDMKKGLWKSFGGGYEEAYDTALEWLM